MLTIKIALVVLIGWVICERWVWPKIKKQDPPEPPEPDTEDAARRGNPFRATSEARLRAENRQLFIQEIEDFCLAEGLDLKVWEAFEFDALGIRLHDRKTNRAMQARVKREDYEERPAVSAARVMKTWEGGKNGNF